MKKLLLICLLLPFSAQALIAFPVNQGGTGSTTLSGLLKGNGTGQIQTAVSGLDYQAAGNYLTSAVISLNGLLGATQTLASSSPATGGWGFSSATTIHTLTIPIAGASIPLGLLSSGDWTIFNNKQAAGNYENVLTFIYPLTRSSNTISSALSTTTSQTWSGTNLFQNATNTAVGLTILNGTTTNATTSDLYIVGSTNSTPLTISTTTATAASTTLFMIDRAGDLHFGGGTPTLSSCGTNPTLDANSTDQVGSITFGATAAGCTLTFSVVKLSRPHCLVSTEAVSLVNAYTVTETTSTLVITQAGSGGVSFDYFCPLGH